MAELYLDFFKFKKSPFHITPDPDFLFLSPTHKEASAAIFYGIETRKGFVAVTGEVGVGKTTVLRAFIKGADPEKIRIVYIVNPDLSFDRLLKQLCCELGIQGGGDDPAELIDALFHHLSEEYENERNVVLIIDEAQNMPAQTLDRLRMLSNLETNQDKLLQIILVGQPEFEAKMNLPDLRQLKQRIAIRSRILALTPEESIAYIYHRLMKASLFLNPAFSRKALRLIIKNANGIPRTINILCDNALITAFGYQRKPVDHEIVKEVIRDFEAGKPGRAIGWKIIWVPAVAVCFAVALYVSPGIRSRFASQLTSKQSFRPKLTRPPSGADEAEQLVGANPAVSVMEENPGQPSSAELAGSGAGAGQKSRAGGAVGSKSEIGTKPEILPAPTGAKPSTRSAPGGDTAAVVGAKPAPGGEAFLQKAPEGLSTHLKPSAQPEEALTNGAHLKSKPSSSALVVKRGDSLYKVLLGVYGRVDQDMIRSFKILNPQVKNINRISAGETIILPQVESAKP
ncbi:MAG: AAA family ATPase [Syntrophobacteraceae bacterium]|nr:AAA family ATPase [Syntrophobacteraceae bacterium]